MVNNLIIIIIIIIILIIIIIIIIILIIIIKTVKNNNTGTNEVQMVLNRISSVTKDVIFNILCVWRCSLLYNCCVSVIQFTIVVDPAESVAR